MKLKKSLKFSVFLHTMKSVNMKTLKIFIVILFCFSSSEKLFSQFYYDDNDLIIEIGGGLGMMSCVTDLGGANTDSKIYFNEWNKFTTSPTLFVGVMYQDFLGLRLQSTWGKVSANDATIKGTSGNLISKRNRNLNFRSNIVEIALLTEFHPFMLKYYEDGPPRLSPYLTAGIGYFSFKPEAYFDGRYIDLRPLRLEGQDMTEYPDRTLYKTSQVNVPLGVGIRYEINDLLNVRFEFLHRVLFTDYLDDASNRKWIDPKLFDKYLTPLQAAYAKALYDPRIPGAKPSPARRGNPDDNDTYLTFNFRLGLTLGRNSGSSGSTSLNSFFKRSTRCPR